MIVYSANKGLFVQDVKTAVIATKILNLIREKGLNAGQEREFAAWHNSMKFMRDIVDDPEIDDDVQIAIEYNIPQTSKRVDFIMLFLLFMEKGRRMSLTMRAKRMIAMP